MEYKMRTILALAFLLGDLTNSDEKDLDEEKAYEFGFTIEGMQHRLEKKDVNGIIQGEFGFITADGVYHVTVYATDENGSFRIISMRNIKISPPLDGSPDFSLKAYSSTSKGPQAQLENFRTRPLASSQPVRYQEKIQTSSTKRLNRPFTTQPTLKPSCAGCGYIATSKKPPIRSPTLGSEVVVSFSSENFKAIRENGSIPSNYSGQISEPPTASLKSGDFEKTLLIRLFSSNQLPTKGILPTNITSERELPSNSSYIHPKNIQATPQRYDMERSQAPQKVENNFSDFKNERTLSTYSRNISSQSNSFSNLRNEQNELQRRQKHPQYFSKTSKNLAPLKVSKDLIKIPGNPDIPIRDKYRGMTDGLPPGIDVTDITQILYRFNWTVGFQGHYETGYKNGSKVGGYFVNGSDGISRIVTYVADEFGYRPIVRIVNIGIDSSVTPKDDKTFELKSFEFVWYPLK